LVRRFDVGPENRRKDQGRGMTRAADNERFVRAFQAAHGLTADGWAGAETFGALPDDGPVDGAPRTSQAGVDLIHSFESLRLDAYPDPGPTGLPVTIGWGSTRDEMGRPIKLGDRWTKDRADARF